MFIGEKEIKEIEHSGDGDCVVLFMDESQSKISEKMLDFIQSDVEQKGTITDVVRMKLASKYLQDMADFGLENNMVEQVSMGMQTLAHNLREEAIGKALGCTGALDIKLSKLIEV